MLTQSLVEDINVLTVGGNDQLVDKLRYAINHATEIDIAVSFIRLSGLELILPDIRESIKRSSASSTPLKGGSI